MDTAKFKITGLVDKTDEQNNIIGQYPVGSVQELPVDYGNRAVEAGQAEVVTDSADDVEDDDTEDEDEVTTGEEDATGGTGATGEDEVE